MTYVYFYHAELRNRGTFAASLNGVFQTNRLVDSTDQIHEQELNIIDAVSKGWGSLQFDTAMITSLTLLHAKEEDANE